MITYDLVQKLKDAGFPLTKNVFYGKDILEPEYNYPTLSELIEACGPYKADDFYLEVMGNGWRARLIYHGYFPGWPGIKRDDDNYVDVDVTEFGSTPEEAVANLWLTLNEKL